MKKAVLFFVCLLFLACTSKQAYRHTLSTNHYAKGFEINDCDSFTAVRVFNPWQDGKVLMDYCLVREEGVRTPENGIRIQIPVRKLTATSCTHIGFLSELQATDLLVGICSPSIVYNSEVRQRVRQGLIADVGDAMTPNVERIMNTAPDAVMVSTYAQGDAVTEKLVSLGMPVIYNNEWTENEPLARAEWIRFVGAFLDKQAQADSIFLLVEKEYNTLCETARKRTEGRKKRTIMSGNNFRGTWYMPSGNTYMGRLFLDAGACYPLQNDSSAFSIPLTVENVVMQFGDADVWVGSSARTLKELGGLDEKHTWFRSYQTGEVYNFLHRSEADANDFWESGVVHPERILNDLIGILYPESGSDDESLFYYSEKLR